VQRGRRRVTLTALTLAAGLAMIVGTTGLINFFGELMLPQIKGSTQQGAWMIGSADFAAGMSAYRGMDKLTLSPETVAQVHQTVEGRASTVEWHFAIVPELSFFGDSYFSFVMHPREVRASGEWTFAFTEGDWETARPIMEKGCGVLISPLVASRNGVSLGETFEVTGRDGPVECTVAGIGSPYVGASIVSAAAIESFGVTGPIVLLVSPLPGADRDALAADLAALSERRPDVVLGELKDMARLQTQVTDALPTMLNALLLLAILAAALGVVNTTMISVAERRRELGLLRAVGATRRQVIAVVAGEAALMGLVGGGLGLVAGAGTTVILAVTYGGNAWGAPDLALWPAAWRSVGPALLNGLAGLVAAPFICAGAAWLPARAVETLQTDRQQPTFPRRVVGGLLNRGSIRTRFVLGTGLLTFIVLAGLIGGVIAHARAYMEDQLHGALSTMITASASAIELGLPGDAEALTGATFETGPFDVTAMLRLQALMADLSANGLADLTVANRDNVVLFNLDPRRVGTILPPLEASDHTQVHTRRAEGERQMVATAPIRAKDGRVLGSVRMTVHLNEARAFLDRLRNTLWAIGSLVLLGGLALSWTLSTPLVVATQHLAAHAARVGRGDYTPFSRRRRRWPGHKTSLRTRLTVALALMLAVMVGVLEGVTIPIERQHVERALLKSLATATEWMGQVASETIVAELPLDRPLTLDAALQMGQAFDLAKLQELGEQMRNENLAYLALVGRDGTIQASDQLSLVGQTTSLPAETQIEEARWHDEEIWVASTPLRHGRAGEPVGALQLGVRHAAIETFLDESRSLFRLTGLIAVLAGVLLAQAIGGVATAPVRHLVAGVRQVTQGDLDVQFKVDSHDELALLAGAFNQMVAGLREREWLRDTFGRFVSREVAEAIRTGQVRLEGENRVVSVLFCDIRGFTTRSEQSTPAQIVALLNEYLPVVIEAAQRHEGTVNKFGGDSTLIVYGAPRRLQESAYRAVLTALEVRANLKILNARLVERGQAPLRIGVGINTGMALAGAVGPKERQEYTVIGDTVNLASRIEALNKTYPEHDILISGRTYEALGRRQGEFEFADLGRVSIRGKVEAVQVWGVVGFKVLHARSLRHV
jgi:adenylate cyclase